MKRKDLINLVCLFIIVILSIASIPSFVKYCKKRCTMTLNQHAIFGDYLYGCNVFYDTVTAGESKYVLFRPPRSDTSEYRIFPTVEVNGDFGHLSWTFGILPDSVSDTGETVTASTRNLEFPKISRMKVYKNPTFSSTDSIHINRGMAPQTGPQTSTNPFVSSEDFFRLEPNLDYLFRMENRGSQAGIFVLNFRWYEIRPHIGLKN